MELNLRVARKTSSLEILEVFKRATGQLVVDARQLGVKLTASHQNFQKFASIDAPQQEDILKYFSSYYTTLLASYSKGADLADSRSTLWWALGELGLRPPADLFNHLESDDVFEIYSPEHIQIFRSLNFFDLTSYSIEDIFSYQWDELYERDESITKAMLEVGGKVMSGEATGVVTTDFPAHVVVDKFSPDKEWSLIKHKLFAPLKSKDNRIYVFNAFKVVNRKKVGH